MSSSEFRLLGILATVQVAAAVGIIAVVLTTLTGVITWRKLESEYGLGSMPWNAWRDVDDSTCALTGRLAVSECLSCKGIFSESAMRNGCARNESKESRALGLGEFILDMAQAIQTASTDVCGGEAFVHKVRLSEQVQLKGNFLLALLPRCCGPCAVVHRAFGIMPRLAATMSCASVAAGAFPFALDVEGIAGNFWPIVYALCAFVSSTAGLLSLVMVIDGASMCSELIEALSPFQTEAANGALAIIQAACTSPQQFLPAGLFEAMARASSTVPRSAAPAMAKDNEADNASVTTDGDEANGDCRMDGGCVDGVLHLGPDQDDEFSRKRHSIASPSSLSADEETRTAECAGSSVVP